MKRLYRCTSFCSDWMSAIVVIGRGRRGRDRMVVGFHITTNVVSSNLANYYYYTSCKNLLISLDIKHLTFLNSLFWCRKQIVITPSAITPSRAELCRTGK